MYKSILPNNVSCGDALPEIGGIVKNQGFQRVFVITDKGVRGAGLTDKVTAVLESVNAAYEVNDEIAAEPSYQEVQRIVDAASAYGPDLLLAVGGGTVMDTAKLCSLLVGAEIRVSDLLEDPARAKKRAASMLIPTTCGTGSEATMNAIVAVPEKNVKVGIVNQAMIPDFVILDPSLIERLPRQIIAATGIDALAHAVECFTSNKANPISDVYALAAAEFIFKNIEAAYGQPENRAAKESMLMGAFLAGEAITASGTTAVHALSYPLGGKYHIPHGISNAILFEPVMRFNQDAVVERLARLCDHVYPAKYALSAQEKADYIISEIARIVANVQIPVTLEPYGVSEADLDFLVPSAYGVKRLLDNNVKKLTPDDIRRIYKTVL